MQVLATLREQAVALPHIIDVSPSDLPLPCATDTETYAIRSKRDTRCGGDITSSANFRMKWHFLDGIKTMGKG